MPSDNATIEEVKECILNFLYAEPKSAKEALWQCFEVEKIEIVPPLPTKNLFVVDRHMVRNWDRHYFLQYLRDWMIGHL